jgi:hypothetical protein
MRRIPFLIAALCVACGGTTSRPDGGVAGAGGGMAGTGGGMAGAGGGMVGAGGGMAGTGGGMAGTGGGMAGAGGGMAGAGGGMAGAGGAGQPADAGTSLWDGGIVRDGGSINGFISATFLRTENGLRVRYNCLPLGVGTSVWGTDIYTDDSSICFAGVHAGAITDAGGPVTIEIRPGLPMYIGSLRNGVQTLNYGQWSGSYVIIP